MPQCGDEWHRLPRNGVLAKILVSVLAVVLAHAKHHVLASNCLDGDAIFENVRSIRQVQAKEA